MSSWTARMVLLASVSVSLGGCSSIPDAVNPVAWYHGVVGSDSSDDADASQPYPDIKAIPAHPDTTPSQQRRKLEESLIADRDHPPYAELDTAPPPPPAPARSVADASNLPPVPPAGDVGAQPAPQSAPQSAQGLAPKAKKAPRAKPAEKVYTGAPHPLSEYKPGAAKQTFQAAIIQFERGSAHLAPDDLAVLHQIPVIYRRYGGTVRVVGHSAFEAEGALKDGPVNAKVAFDRSAEVAKTLAHSGLDPKLIYAGAVSDTQPASKDTSAEGLAANRRVEIFIDY